MPFETKNWKVESYRKKLENKNYQLNILIKLCITFFFCFLLDYCHLQLKCNGHGTCRNDGSCQCHDGFYGEDCLGKPRTTKALDRIVLRAHS